jgi:acetoin utilization protein AcuB
MKIQDVMTACPHYIDAQSTLEAAVKKMELQGIRHLPVVDKGALIGIISDRDAKLSQFVCKTTNYCPNCGEVCVSDFFSVSGNSDVADVALQMAENRYECAIVCDKDENVIGIFTTTDACRLVHLALKDSKSIKA